jgi:tetratricopeptide (TPR) repeat protein
MLSPCVRLREIISRVLGMLVLLLAAAACGPLIHTSELSRAGDLHKQAVRLEEQGRPREALPLAEEALSIWERVHGPEHPHSAIGLNDLAMLCESVGDYTRAEELYQRCVAMWERIGPEQPDAAAAFNNLGVLYQARGEYGKAEPLLKRALAIGEKTLGPDHPAVARGTNNLGLLYKSVGEYAQAGVFYRKALASQERSLGPEHPDLAKGFNNLGVLYVAMGDLAQGEASYKRALAIRERALGPEHPDAAPTLNNLALLYQSRGDYARAEPLYRRAIAIWERALGSDHPEVGRGLSNLADLYMALGDLGRAEPLSRRAIAIWEKSLGAEHLQVASGLNNLGTLLYYREDYAQAESLFQRALGILERSLGPRHPDVAVALGNMAAFFRATGDRAAAESFLVRALAIRESALGAVHPDVATTLNNLGGLHGSLGEYERAEWMYARAADIWEKTFGPDHADVAMALANLATVHAATLRFESAYSLAKRAQEIDSGLIDHVMGFTSEEQKLKFLWKKEARLEVFLSLVSQHLRGDGEARREALNVWLRRKGVALEAQRRFQEALLYTDDPEAMEISRELAVVRSRLSRMVLEGTAVERPEGYRRRLEEFHARKQELEARLSQLSQPFAARRTAAAADSRKIARALPAESALVEFARCGTFRFDAKGQDPTWGPDRYLAFVLRAGEGDRVALLDLGDAEVIEQAVLRLRKETAEGETASPARLQRAARLVHDLAFQPLREELGSAREIFISPDGTLNLIPYEALLGPDGRYLVEEYTFNYLAAGRDLLGFGQGSGPGGIPVLMGDPDFDMDTAWKGEARGRERTTVPAPREGGRRSVEMQGHRFAPLPMTREEVVAIRTLLGERESEAYTGGEAREAVLANLRGPRILHLATHGFFLADEEAGQGSRGSGAMGSNPDDATGRPRVRDPLLRSGIALAGANRTLGVPDVEASEGIVTAEKILGLRLTGTDMVVLSACETGLGEVRSGEGVFGLRRSFSQAGARSLVMSLWPVPDRETQELMVEFYRNVVTGAMNRCQALRQSMLRQMRIVKERYGEANPFFWGAFVFMGEP